jgi:hypothetical protein
VVLFAFIAVIVVAGVLVVFSSSIFSRGPGAFGAGRGRHRVQRRPARR